MFRSCPAVPPRRGLRCALLCLALIGGGAAASPPALFDVPGHWVDERDQPFRFETLRGSYSVVNMAYGACRRVCSASLRAMEQLQALAEARGQRMNFVVVGLDPSQDKPADWAAYRSERKGLGTNWRFLSGDAAATQRIARWLGVNYWHYGEHVLHDYRLVLVSPEGRAMASLTAPDQDPRALLR
jgi:cytochrome oxidase Cu insertion factor (SCO1/SenC/PrrC family)